MLPREIAPEGHPSRSFTAIRKDAGLCCGSRLRSGEVFAYVGLPQNLKDLKDRARQGIEDGGTQFGQQVAASYSTLAIAKVK